MNSMMQNLPQGAFSTKGMQEKIPSGYRKYQVQNFSPEQQGLFGQLFSHLGPESPLSKLAMGDESTFGDIEAPALRQFNELQGNIASRFSGMGSGARRSSGFQNTINSAASNFAQELQANRQALQRQALLDLMGYSDTLLRQRPFTSGLAEKPEKKNKWGWLGELAGGIPGFLTGGAEGAQRGVGNTISALMGF